MAQEYIQWKTRLFCTAALLYWINCSCVAQATTCFKVESLGDREGNVYYCEEKGKPECCEENSEYTCCESQSEKTWREQLILWGVVGGLVLLISLLCCYFWRDNVCSKSERSMSCCSCCRKSEREDLKHLASVPEPGPSKLSSFSPRPWRFAGQGIADDDRDSPAPAFHFKQPAYKKY